MGLPAADHWRRSGTALSSPSEPKERRAALRRKPSGESPAMAASSVAKALGALTLPKACNAAAPARQESACFVTELSCAATDASTFILPISLTAVLGTHVL